MQKKAVHKAKATRQGKPDKSLVPRQIPIKGIRERTRQGQRKAGERGGSSGPGPGRRGRLKSLFFYAETAGFLKWYFKELVTACQWTMLYMLKHKSSYIINS